MLHMAGVRSGAWCRRALMRAHGWWHASADALLQRDADLGWTATEGPLYASALLHVSVCSAFASLEEVDVLGWLLYPVLWPLGWAANLIEVCDDDVEGDPAMRMRYEWQVNNRCARGRLDRRGSMLAAVHTDAGGAPLDVDAWGDF